MNNKLPSLLRPLDVETIREYRNLYRGTVCLVGGGPGDPELMTVRAYSLVASAEVLLVDHLAPDVRAITPSDCEIIDVAKLPYGKSVAQEKINELLVTHSREGKTVVRLKGGDPYVFGRGLEEKQYCTAHDITTTTIPGITSAIAVPESAGVSVTHRGVTHEFTVVSGHLPPGHPKSLVNWDALAAMTGTICIIMGVKNGEAIAHALINGGRSPHTPVHITQEGTTEEQKTFHCELESLGRTLKEVNPPAVIVIGKVAGL